ncbi:winged helix-turn-helix domain-containing protein [Sporolactobacillus pectinivorans]|uniref:winged helix-turn-helix domain-containing protein n=1 Tax=Sporolactobacillus pectinivorans TaxID=1591408 RepID=UPI001961C740|nr:helix-turn-helix domain-containing protein [Sporolactobacillus pectinivorans]
MDRENGNVDKVLVALANPAHRGSLNEIAVKGQVTATTLADRVMISRQVVVKHLDVLKGHGKAHRAGSAL